MKQLNWIGLNRTELKQRKNKLKQIEQQIETTNKNKLKQPVLNGHCRDMLINRISLGIR